MDGGGVMGGTTAEASRPLGGASWRSHREVEVLYLKGLLLIKR